MNALTVSLGTFHTTGPYTPPRQVVESEIIPGNQASTRAK